MTYEELEQENAVLRFRLEELLSSAKICPLPELNGAKFRILNLLAKRSPEAVRYEALHHAMNENPQYLISPHKALKVHVSRSRAVLKSFGIEIETIWGIGYKLPAKSAAKWTALVDQANGRCAA